MIRRIVLVLFSLVLLIMPVTAQDGIDLPADLYLLLNEGIVQRVGLGRSGIVQVTPDDVFVLDFAVAPDDNWLAYRTQEGITLTNMYSNALPQSIENERASVPFIRGRGATIAWSPDSNALAYTTLYGGRVWYKGGIYTDLLTPDLINMVWSPGGSYLAAEAENNVWWIFRRDPDEMRLVSAIPVSPGTAWVNDSTLAFVPPEGGVILMDMAQGNAQSILLPQDNVYYLPHWDGEGIEVYFSTSVDQTAPTGRLLRVLLDGTIEPISELDVELRALRWGPEGDWLLAFQGNALALVNPLNGQGFTLPFNGISTYGWGIVPAEPLDMLALPAPASFIAIGNTTGIAQAWRMNSDQLPVTITPAVVDVTEYAISFDGERVAYVSNSSLWLHTVGSNAAPLELVRLGIDRNIHPAFSADGMSLFYRDVEEAGGGIWVLDLTNIEMPAEPTPRPTAQPTLEPGTPTATATINPNETPEPTVIPTFVPTSTPMAENVPLVLPDYSPEIVLPDTETGIAYISAEPAPGVGALLVRSESATSTQFELYDPGSGTLQPIGHFEHAQWLRGSNLLVQGTLSPGALPGLHRIDINALTTAPTTLLNVLEGWRILDTIEREDGGIRVLVQQQQPGTVAVMDAPANGGAPSVLADIGYINSPRLSPNGDMVIGLTHPGGMLVRVDLRGMVRNRLRGIEGATSFRWN
ncbi:MAG: hypothetical protein H6670_03590 [Anaerolineaceae bacterium]|nr:hypothetical protein [Anaerolineaceae bacterium]